MKRIFFLFWLVAFLLFPAVPVQAQGTGVAEQNVVLSCLEPTNTDLVLTGGELNNYTTGLYDKAGIFKPENGPVYVLISYPVPGFKPADSKYSDTCEQRHNSNEEGQYWFCADLKGNGSQCPASMLAPATQILQPKNAPKEPSDPDEGSCLKTIFQIENASFVGEEFKVEWAKMYTLLHNNVTFWGLQFTSDEASLSASPSLATGATTSLKLASFIGENVSGIPSGVNTNCTTVSWDPYGRIIDSYTLEPIRDVLVSLKNTNASNVLSLTKNPSDPTFRNPFSTNSQGGFNFAVIPGTYYLYPAHPDFTFPIPDQAVYDQAVANLQILDPLQEYIEINKPNSKLYQNSQEAIVEVMGASQRRDIIMQPKNANYQGSPAELISIQNSRQGIQQLLRGIVSHPKSIIKAMINNLEVGQTTADLKGNFELYLNEDLIPNTAENYQVTVQKVPLVDQSEPTAITTSSPSETQSLKLIPAVLSGFIFNEDYQVVPNAKVEIVLTNLSAFAYTTVYSDKNGFISIPYQNLPATDFFLKVYPSNQKPFELTISQFLQLNTVYLEEAGVNMFNPKLSTVNLITPDQKIIDQVKSVTAARLTGKNVFRLPTPTPTPAPRSGNTQTPLNLIGALAGLVLLTVLAIVVVKKLKKTPPAAPPPSVQPPEDLQIPPLDK